MTATAKDGDTPSRLGGGDSVHLIMCGSGRVSAQEEPLLLLRAPLDR